MTGYEPDPKLFHETADYLEASAAYQTRTDSALAVLLCANIIRGFLKLSKTRQVEINLLGSGLPIALVSDLVDEIRLAETLKELVSWSVSQN